MKDLTVKSLIFFFAAVLAFSNSGCSGSAADTGNTAGTDQKTTGKTGDSSKYPPMPTGIANAEVTFLDGTKSKLGERKGKVMMLNLWGTWCGPCRAEMPHLVELQEKYGEKGFEVLGLNIGDGGGTPEPTDKIERFVEMMKLNYPIARMENKDTAHFYRFTGQASVPTSLLIDAEGHIRGVFIGGGQNVFDKMKTSVKDLMES